MCDRDLSDAYLINAACRRPPRRPHLRLSVHLRRTRDSGLRGLRESGAASVLAAAHLVGPRQEAGHEPPAGPTGPRRPGRAGLHGAGGQRAVAHRHHRAPHRARASSTSAPSRMPSPTGSSATRWTDRMPAALAVAALGQRARDSGRGLDNRPQRQGISISFATVFVRALARAELRGSMGRVATCADNAAMESFFSLLQKNVLDTKRWATTRGAPPGHRHLDRADLQPSPASADPREAHARRI